MAAARQEKLKMIFQHFDINGDGKLDRAEMAALIQAMNPRTSLTGDQTDAAVDEVFRAYADFLAVDDDPGLTLDVLLRSCGDGTPELDRDFETLGLSLDTVDGAAAAPYSRAAADATAQGISPASLSQPPDLFQPIQEEDLMGDESGGQMDGGAPSPRPPASWGPQQYSMSSSLASSSFCSETDYSDLEDYEDPYLRMEIEEIASFRWLPPSFRRKPQRISRPESSEIDWQQLIPPDSWIGGYDADLVEKGRDDDNWVVFGEDVSTRKRCCVVQARGLIIRWQENRACWRYKGADAVLSEACGLEIGAEVGAASLSPGTDYVCVLVFDLVSGAFGLGLRGETQEASVYVGGRRVSRRTVRLQPPAPECPNSHDGAGEPRRRKDGWMEMALGEFSLGKKSGAAAAAAAAAVRVELRDVKAQPKSGLVVRGVELTPAGFAYKRLIRGGTIEEGEEEEEEEEPDTSESSE